MHYDLVIVGAGPVGLALALALRGHGLHIALVERQPETLLAAAPDDGREIALTHHSLRFLHDLGAWAHIPGDQISPLREARVLDGRSPAILQFDAAGRGQALGQLVPNHCIRRALYCALQAGPGIDLVAQTTVAALNLDAPCADLHLTDGRSLQAPLVVAADSRFSELRRAAGIGASMLDFGTCMMVGRVTLGRPHDGIAYEWFDYGQTLALLPLNGSLASLVITLPAAQQEALMRLDDAAFGREMTRRTRARWGDIRPAGPRHAYPLVAVWAEHFVTRRCALVGDAAVGMHPVTAHGFNLGLRGAAVLAQELLAARARGCGLDDPEALGRYERRHRRACRPLYLATNALVQLYTDDRWPARLLRAAGLRAAQRATPLRRAVSAALMQRGLDPDQ